MKRFFCRLTGFWAFALALVLLCGVGMPAVQAQTEEEKLYISEIYVCISTDRPRATAFLEEAGYLVVDQDLNVGAGSDSLGVFVGLKTTRDPKEAITDIALLPMNGGYSYADIRVLNDFLQGEALTSAVEALQCAAGAFSAALQEGSKPAAWANEVLNRFYDSETGLLLGDLMRSDPSATLLTRILTRGNLSVLSLLFQVLYIGAGDASGSTVASALQGADPQEPADAESLTLAQALFSNWSTIGECLTAYRSTLALENGEEPGCTLADYLAQLNDRELGRYLLGKAYDSVAASVVLAGDAGTLADLLSDPFLSAQDLAFVTQAMTRGQRALAPYLTPDVALFAGYLTQAQAPAVPDTETDTDPDNTGTSDPATQQQVEPTAATVTTETDEATNAPLPTPTPPESYEGRIPLCFGITDEIYGENGIALTAEAKQYSYGTADLQWLWTGESYTAEITAITTAALEQAIADTAWYTCGAEKTDADPLEPEQATQARAAATAYWTEAVLIPYQTKLLTGGLSGLGATALYGRMSVGAVTMVHSIWEGLDVYNESLPQYKQIPGKIFHLNSDRSYTLYQAVEQCFHFCLLPESPELEISENETGTLADLNGWSGTQWIAMYVTKDLTAGKPILARDVCVWADQGVGALERSFAHLFGSAMPYNLNTYAQEDRLGGIYMYFDRDIEYGSRTPTLFSRLDLCLAIGGGSVGGIIIGAVAVFVRYETKRKKEATIQE